MGRYVWYRIDHCAGEGQPWVHSLKDGHPTKFEEATAGWKPAREYLDRLAQEQPTVSFRLVRVIEEVIA